MPPSTALTRTAPPADAVSVSSAAPAAADKDDGKEVAEWVAKAQRANGNLAALSSLSAFQRQMDRFPQLDPDSLAALFLVIGEAQNATQELESGSSTSRRRATQLQRTVREGEKAVEAVTGSTFRLVLIICRELAERRYGRERALDALPDLVGEANVALIEAVRKFDPNCGPAFPTYAARVVRNQVRYTLQREGIVKSTASWGRMRRIAAVRIPILGSELGRQPTEAEIRADLMAYCMQWAKEHLTPAEQKLDPEEREKRMIAKLKKQGMIGALNNLGDVIQSAMPVASLDAPIAGTDGAVLRDVVPESDKGGFDELELKELRETLGAALQELPEREQRIIHLRYGMVDNVSWTYQQIGKEFNVTPERIRQIERQVLDKLRGPSGVRESLASYFPNVED